MAILIFIIISYFVMCFGLSHVFKKAGIDSTKAWIPVINGMEWAELIGRSKYYGLWLLFPIVNIFIFVSMTIDTGRSFGRFGFLDTVASAVYGPGYLTWLGSNQDEKYKEPIVVREKEYKQKFAEYSKTKNERKLKKLVAENPFERSSLRDWFESIFFAVFAATFLRLFLIEAYVIPTPSMENSLNVGDYLFVSKASYGIRMPMTVAMLPLLHNRIPVIDKESYLEKPSLPYYRLPALRDLERNTPFVFNWPIGDSVYITSRRSYNVDQIKREPDILMHDRELSQLVQKKEIITRPLDKKDLYIKRCVGIAGDTLEIRNKQIYINGQKGKNPIHLQYKYLVNFTSPISQKKLYEWDIDVEDYKDNYMVIFADKEKLDKIKSVDPKAKMTTFEIKEFVGKVDSTFQAKLEFFPGQLIRNNSGRVFARLSPENLQVIASDPLLKDKFQPLINPVSIFPHDPKNFPGWTVDNYGPIWIPKKGATVTLTPENIALYQRVIANYEYNDFEEKNGRFYINGQETNQYTFSQDYYWAMGDNRHNSEDSRAWGFVPFDHVIGRPLIIWMSAKDGNISNGINWDRVMTSASKTEFEAN